VLNGVTDHVSGSLSELDRLVIDHVPPGGNWRDLPPDFPSKRIEQIRVGASNGGGSRSTYYGRLRADRPAYTINTYMTRPGNGCFIHP
jgi:DNA (cytosine-5)-methyltransferase 1